LHQHCRVAKNGQQQILETASQNPGVGRCRPLLRRGQQAPLTPSTEMFSAAALEPALAHGVPGVLAFAKEFFVAHDRLVRMKSPPVLHVGLIVGYSDHEAGGANGPFL
jgi:hypothetical protein